jgi:hypothetical protein
MSTYVTFTRSSNDVQNGEYIAVDVSFHPEVTKIACPHLPGLHVVPDLERSRLIVSDHSWQSLIHSALLCAPETVCLVSCTYRNAVLILEACCNGVPAATRRWRCSEQCWKFIKMTF